MLCTRPVLPPAQQHAGGAASQNEGNGEPQRCEHRGEKICSACYKNGRRPVCTADDAHAGALKIKKQKGKNGKPVSYTHLDVYKRQVWNSLNEDNKVSLFVRYIDLATGKTQDRIVNKYEKV